ncbi:type II toxin-antitoxin system RelE/ParE family toxin [Neisseria dentiae]|uniref:type II toxin-antitoxin system RelE/ParE family toxin n=1 Tax=Neisseria dentiae TaxID=194197 RepID=UPI00211CE044|nr:type II toxin-antitoxin system RelE/ParE family toxin [Neisseria dentiae]MCQ9326930.1 type II toxin-antitoxin system RelE/ParE family toxin [Neisseria dentiae]
MPQVVLTEKAVGDLNRLYEFLVDKNPTAAVNAIRAIKAALNDLAVFPAQGRYFDDVYREWPVPFGSRGYLVLYRIEHDTVIIVSVRHQLEERYS